MRSERKKLRVGVIDGAPKPWRLGLEQVCPIGITRFFDMDQTARTGP